MRGETPGYLEVAEDPAGTLEGVLAELLAPAPLAPAAVAWLAVRETFAPFHTAWIPPEACMKIAAAARVSNAVSRQYSAKSCPLSSFRKRLRNARNIMTTKPRIILDRTLAA